LTADANGGYALAKASKPQYDVAGRPEEAAYALASDVGAGGGATAYDLAHRPNASDPVYALAKPPQEKGYYFASSGGAGSGNASA